MNQAEQLYNNLADTGYLHSLRERWRDECQYEDFAEYERAIENYAAKFAVKVTKVKRQPFGFECEADGARYLITAKGNQLFFAKLIAQQN